MKKIIFLFLLLFAGSSFAAEFDELDKPPEGAHEGQMLLGFFSVFGVPGGSFIDAEKDFVDGSTYTFQDSDITKELDVSHLSFGIGISFEYMPIDYIGACVKLRRTYIVQKTNFGSEYENWKGYLYRDISLFIGPAFHATNRKRWDFILTPMLGYAFSKYNATPVAKQLLDGYEGKTQKSSNGLAYGAELTCTIYFSGGLYISLGGEWIRNKIDLGSAFDLTNPQTGNKYTASSSGEMTSLNALVAIGYAFAK